MGTLTDHIVNPANDKLIIEVLDEARACGANHLYMVKSFNTGSNQSCPFTSRHGSLSPEAQAAAKSSGLDNNQSALLAAAKHKEPDKQVEAIRQRGELPAAPDFSAETHKRFRPKLAELVALVRAGDLAALKAVEIKTASSSPKAIAKFRDHRP